MAELVGDSVDVLHARVPRMQIAVMPEEVKMPPGLGDEIMGRASLAAFRTGVDATTLPSTWSSKRWGYTRSHPTRDWSCGSRMRCGSAGNSTVYQWAPRGTRPRQPADHRYESTYLFGALCPARDTGAALVLPVVNTKAMQRHLAEISATAAPGAHAIILMDQAAWHTTAKLEVPGNLSIVCIPPATPELNPAGNVWQFLRQTYLRNRVFRDYDDIVGRLCEAWRALLDEPGRIESITYRDWALVDQYL